MNLFSCLGSKVNPRTTLDDKIVNWDAKASSAVGIFCYHLWNKRGIKIETKIVVLTTLLYELVPWTLYW